MRFGVQLPETEYEATWPQMRDMARTADEAGFDSLWVGDHLLYENDGQRTGPWEAWSLLAGVAAVTERIEIGPLVAALPFHHPAVLAKAAVAIDEISSGRLIFGIGAGWNRVEFDAFGLPFEKRVSRFAEAFSIIRQLLGGDRVDFEGDFYQLAGAELIPGPRRSGEIPFMVGSRGERMLALTLPHVEWWNSWYSGFGNDPHRIKTLVTQVEEACVAAGRDPATLKKSVALYIGFETPDHQELGPGRGGVQPWRGSDDEMVERLRVVEDAGIDEVQGILDPITPESIERFGEIVTRYRTVG